MDKRRPPRRGFTLIELMIAISIFTILALLAMPMYSQFMANTQIRTATESILAGVRTAQTEAVKRNGNVQLRLDPTTGWAVYQVDDDGTATKLTEASFAAGAPKVTVTPSGDSTRVTFNGLGRLVNPNPPPDGSVAMTRVDVKSAMTVSDTRPLRIVIGSAGSAYGIKVCDPALPSADPAGCP